MADDFVMLAHTYNPDKHDLTGWLASEKLDGQRAFWDGGVSEGMLAKNVPWANTDKDKKDVICTGLWSRLRKVIHAPKWFTEKLPRYTCLDGELWMGRDRFQEVMSVCRRHVPDERWEQVKYMVFDTPNPEEVFMKWGVSRTECLEKWHGIRETFNRRLPMLQAKYPDLPIIGQQTIQNKEHLDQLVDDVISMKGEGLIARAPYSLWTPARSHSLLKVKPWYDMEGKVIGWTEGEGKLAGMMGALIIHIGGGKEMKMSGFTDAERELNGQGEPVHFKKGEVITFRFRELSNEGIPLKSAYLRKASIWNGL